MVIKFETYYITPVQIKDAWRICDFVISNEDRLKRYFPKTVEQNLNPELSKLFVENTLKQQDRKELFLFLVKENKSNKIIGLIYINSINWLKKQAELAYCIGYEYENKGITSASVRAISIHAFNVLKLEKLQIIVHKSNLSSIKVAKNCNFEWQKVLKAEFTPFNEHPLDMELYELSNI